ncbi:Gfo/Idh/MocA family oxidoreductase [Anoxybacillus sp. ST4]|uniref:Gfo/Idh/MocA family oxidoreductase n=1 Tax=Anoxybacillus sp. ST4 TaxID=2864181 RepID=UPI001C643EB0|nr:Gfo/Idh/MocA family oxidoreductase [Anoxybacillus sp. ST4]
MKKVITYGTFDLFHEGHYRLLKRAKELGDYLIVGVTTENYDKSRGKLNVQQSLIERIENVRKCGLADEIIIEEYEGQKIEDIQKYNIDVFAIGSDWIGKFDYLKNYCDVVYLERTRGISSTELRNKYNGIVRLGLVGNGRIARRFVKESKYVSGVNIEGVFGRKISSLRKFVEENELEFFSTNYEEFIEKVDAVYIATPHHTHYQYAKEAILRGKHVLCEKPMVLSVKEAEELYILAKNNNCVLLEAIKTAYSPGFIRLVSLAKSGIIGEIKSIDATFTKLIDAEHCRELDPSQAGGSMTELGSYLLLAFIKLLGRDIKELRFYSYFDKEKNVDLFTKFNLLYPGAIATGKVGLGVKSEGDLIISGTKGYIYVPSPWWKTEYFEVRYEDSNMNKKYYYKFEGDGLRYELAEFLSLINKQDLQSYKLEEEESIQIIRIIEKFMSRENVVYL